MKSVAIRSVCTVENCNLPHIARGYCEAHYRRWKAHGDPLGGGTAQGAVPKWIKEVALPYAGVDCLIWPFSRLKDGYPQGGMPGFKGRRAHRVICEVVNGPPPTPDHEAAHSCGRGDQACVHPLHLSWKTHAENEADKDEHGTRPLGSAHRGSRLTEEQVNEIRSLIGAFSHAAIAERFGVSRPTISLIAEGVTWAWLK